MKPVAIFRFAKTEEPGYLTEFLDGHKIPQRLIRIDAGDQVPTDIEAYSGLVCMGGPMSVNDELPWIPPVLELIRRAVATDRPVLGHCLGAQLMSKALGGVVKRNPVKEIGWGMVYVHQNREAQRWFGTTRAFLGFHWHGETFSIPRGAVNLLSSSHCEHQAFAMGKHLGLQCHIEMTSAMVRTWCHYGADEIVQAQDSPGVQAVDEIKQDLADRIGELNRIAYRVYASWIEGLTS